MPRGALRRRVRATDAPAKVQRCTRQLQSFALPYGATFALPYGATFALTPSVTFALPGVPPLRSPLFYLCAFASASMQVGDATGACLMRHTALPRNGGAMQNAAGNPIRKEVPAFSVLPKIYFPSILLAPMDAYDNLSGCFREMGAFGSLLAGAVPSVIMRNCVRTWHPETRWDSRVKGQGKCP